MSGLIAVPENEAIATAVLPRRQTASNMPRRPMTVAIYMHDLSGGGVERQSLVIAEEFQRQGLDVTLVLHQVRGPLLSHVPPGLRIVDLASRRTLDDIPRLSRYLRKEKPDLLLANVDLNNVAALLAKALAFSPTKIVICQHNPIVGNYLAYDSALYRYVGVTYWLLSPLISRAVGVSAGVAEELHTVSRIRADRVVTINNPVVGPDFAWRSQQDVEHPWFGDADHPVFVTAGRLVPQKDHATMLRALALHRRYADSRLIILGSGPLQSSLEALAEQLGIRHAIDFVGYQANALPFFRQANAFVLSSRCEGFGNVLVEALGCGTPVISTRCAHGPAEILDEGRYGLLVDPGNPVALAVAMDQVSMLREQFPAPLLKERAAAFSYAACASRYLSLFKTLAPHRAWAV